MSPGTITTLVVACILVAASVIAWGGGLGPAASRAHAILVASVFAAATAVRVAGIGAGLPYLAYVDEGHVLHRVVHMLTAGRWEPGSPYQYPLLMEASALAAKAYAPLYALLHGRSIVAAAAGSSAVYYDVIEPEALIVIARVFVLASSLGTVALVVVVATRLAGRPAGVAAGFLAALLPALVSRSAIVIVDTLSAFLALAALYFAVRIGDGGGARAAGLAGFSSGLAATAKYPAGLALVSVLSAVVLASRGWKERLARAALAAVSAAGGLALGLPALFLRTGQVLQTLDHLRDYYARKPPTVSCLRAALDAGEVGPLLLGLGALGTVSLLRTRRARPVTLGWLVFSAVLLGLLLRNGYQPFRNLLPILPFLCVAAGAGLSGVIRGLARRGVVGRRRTSALTVQAAIAVAATMLAIGVKPYLVWHTTIVDTRVAAREWLEGRVQPGDRVLLVEALAFLPSELARLPARIAMVTWPGLEQALAHGAFDYVVTGMPEGGVTGRSGWEQALAQRPVLLTIGHQRTPPPGFWRGNDQLIVIHGPLPAG